MNLNAFSLRDRQNCLAILTLLEAEGISDVRFARARIQETIDAGRLISIRVSARRRPDHIATCQVCGSPAVIVPLSPADRTPAATHAIQCQNRPAIDQPWREGMCGHTEYIA